jgi:hypothetical protein
MPIRELWRSDWLHKMTDLMYDPRGAVRLIDALAASPRFRDVHICGYVSQVDRMTEMQFSAMTLRILPDRTYVAYRGTDNTLLGWKENFNMAFQVQMPSQVQALRYLERTAAHLSGSLWCGGHSKGGTLAIYAAMACVPEVRERLICCFSHDGPGFTSVMRSGLDAEVCPVPVDKTVPRSSVFGMLFERGDQDVAVVRSVSSGMAQHDPLSWEVEDCDFAIESRVGRTATYVDSSLNAWIARASLEERERFVDALFEVFSAGGRPYFHDLRVYWRDTLPKMASAIAELNPDERDLLLSQAGKLIRELAPGGNDRTPEETLA